jgi:hypothetical protein
MRIAVLLLLFFSTSFQNTADEKDRPMEPYLLLDDFDSDVSNFNNPWEGFTDQVMGGKSDLFVRKMTDFEGNFIRMTGKVSLENRGGFIQIRQKLSSVKRIFDGSLYDGIRLKVRGVDSGYYIFLRTTSTLLPWQYFSAEIPLSESWQNVYIPWSSFQPGDYGTWGKLKINKLKSLALVAYGKNFNARVDLMEIGFYKESQNGE